LEICKQSYHKHSHEYNIEHYTSPIISIFSDRNGVICDKQDNNRNFDDAVLKTTFYSDCRQVNWKMEKGREEN